MYVWNPEYANACVPSTPVISSADTIGCLCTNAARHRRQQAVPEDTGVGCTSAVGVPGVWGRGDRQGNRHGVGAVQHAPGQEMPNV
jgi:hypothetical protein